MNNVIEPASSGRAKCRGCGHLIQRGELRFGERLPNPFAEGETTQWFHLPCAAYKRPEPFLESLDRVEGPDREHLEHAARRGVQFRRVPRIDGVERAPSSQAKCRCCKQPIARGSWRIRLQFYEEGRFFPGGFIHLGCRRDYFETEDVLERALHFSPHLSDADRDELTRQVSTSRS